MCNIDNKERMVHFKCVNYIIKFPYQTIFNSPQIWYTIDMEFTSVTKTLSAPKLIVILM